MSLVEFRRGRPRPGQFYWYTGSRDKQGNEREGYTYKHPVEVVSWPMLPDEDNIYKVLLFVRHTPGSPTTASWVNLKEIGEMLVSLSPPKG